MSIDNYLSNLELDTVYNIYSVKVHFNAKITSVMIIVNIIFTNMITSVDDFMNKFQISCE